MKDQLKIKKEDNLILLIINSNSIDENEMQFLLEEDLDWDYILKKALNNRIIPLLYWKFKSYQECLPKKIMGTIEKHFNDNVRKNLMMTAELTRLLEMFNNQSINAIPFKGPALAIDAYHNIGLREFNDLDIYVPENNVIAVREILLNEGYYLYYDIGLKKLNKYIEVHNDLKFINKLNDVVLEIHWGFYDDTFIMPSSKKLDVEKNQNLIDMNNLKILNPSPEEMFLILCLHSASHRWDSLILLTDLTKYIESHKINWEYVIEKSDELVIRRILNINLYLIVNMLKFQLPDLISKIVKEDKESVRISRKIQKELLNTIPETYSLKNELIITVKLREKFSYGIKDVFKALTTPAIYEWKNLPLPTYLWFIYAFYRPLNLLWRYKW